jgi:hypothetical protein
MSTIDRDKLMDKIQEEKDGFPMQTLFCISIFILFIFLPGKTHRPSYYNEFGFLKPALISTMLATGLSYYIFRNTIKSLKNDLDSGEKIVESKVVWKKNKSFMSNKYQIYTDSDYKDFKKFDVEEEAYNKIEKGHIVKLEYAEKSKYLYQLNLNL